jgi:DHA2 family methylenomycin A resistance protein-like MFS transporter
MRAAALGCVGIFLGALDFGFMTLAGPAIDRDLELGGAYPWLFSASSFGYGATLMVASRLVDRSGPGVVFRAGLALYGGGLCVAAAAPGAGVLLAGRALLGVGGGALMPAAFTLLAGVEERAGRRLAFASSGGAVAMGFVCGVLLGVAGAESGWRAPLLALCAAVLMLAPLTRGAGEAASAAAPPEGVLAIAASALLAASGLSLAGRAPAAGAAALAATAAAAGAGLRRASGWLPTGSPGRALATSCVAGAATTASGVGAAALLGRALPQTAAASPAATGLVLATFGLAVPLAVPAARAMSGALGAARCGGVGLAAQGIALGGLAAIPLSAHGAVALVIAVFGAGHVVANAGAAEGAMDAASDRPGPVAGLLATAQYVGAGVGALAVLGAAGGETPTAASVRAGLLLATAIALTGALLVLMPKARASTCGVPPRRLGRRGTGARRG